ncbi:MAG: DUF1553 domain-containing protein [Planctomycetota bacterium]|nr:MAG: DUF1553 domain-containing protein [Planctomycetota bacterium]
MAPILLLPCVLASVLAVWRAPAQEPDAEGLEFFEKKVRPVLVENCYQCHSAQAKRPKGGMLLDTREGLRKGGDSGLAIVPGNPEASRLIEAVRYGNEELQMPPDGKLPETVIADLVEWVRMGAPDPRVDERRDGGAAVMHDYQKPTAEEARRFWSFVAPQRPEPPAVADPSWCSNDIDAFVLARLEAAGLRPAPPADKRSLLRRVSFDLTGLPPAPADVEAFLADAAPDAYARVVDRLLASPHYGERWARHWLDLARYADSNGVDENLAMSNAWRYRDYVIRAFNEDKPYDRFLTEQLAGDLLPDPGDERRLYDQWTATGFLVLGPKMLAEQDKEKLSMDIVDEQIDVTSKAALGLTISCARCHDHKFDPVSQRDYYALAGIFRSSSAMSNLDFVSAWRERPLATQAQLAAIAAANQALEDARGSADALASEARRTLHAGWQRDLARYLLAGDARRDQVIFLEAESCARGNLIVDRETWGTADTVIIRTGSDGRQFAEYDVEVPAAGAYVVHVRCAAAESRPMRALVNGVLAAGAALGEVTGSYYPDGQRWLTLAVAELRAGSNVLRLERDGPVPHLDQLSCVPLAHLQASGDLQAEVPLEPELVARWAAFLEQGERTGEPVFAPWNAFRRGEEPQDPALIGGLPPQSAAELAGRYQALFAAVELAAAARREKFESEPLEALWQILHGTSGPFALAQERQESLFPPATQAALAQARQRVTERERERPAEPPAVLCVAEGEIVNLPVHVRGSHMNKAAEAVPRGFPALLDLGMAAPADQSGRLQLAQWLTDPRNPLTARVMVNRIWLGHFGSGLVRTPSNLGLRGEAPTHPELLDWLATEFVRRGWSVKELHRLIVLSSAYRMSSAFDPAAAERDPENRLLWRQNRRRLDAECVRDAILAVSGGLDPALGGTLLPTANRGYVTNDQSADQAQYASRRRAIYLPVVRNAMYDLFSIFDYADASVSMEQRPSSVVASQALFLLNSPLVVHEARRFAHGLLNDAALPDDPARADMAFQRAYGRPPAPEERADVVRYLQRLAAEEEPELLAWERLCQALFASNEFLYVD